MQGAGAEMAAKTRANHAHALGRGQAQSAPTVPSTVATGASKMRRSAHVTASHPIVAQDARPAAILVASMGANGTQTTASASA